MVDARPFPKLPRSSRVRVGEMRVGEMWPPTPPPPPKKMKTGDDHIIVFEIEGIVNQGGKDGYSGEEDELAITIEK